MEARLRQRSGQQRHLAVRPVSIENPFRERSRRGSMGSAFGKRASGHERVMDGATSAAAAIKPATSSAEDAAASQWGSVDTPCVPGSVVRLTSLANVQVRATAPHPGEATLGSSRRRLERYDEWGHGAKDHSETKSTVDELETIGSFTPCVCNRARKVGDRFQQSRSVVMRVDVHERLGNNRPWTEGLCEERMRPTPRLLGG